jgi:hypothetical protein
MLGLGNNLNELRLRIQNVREELAKIGMPEQPLPEVINMTNLLRTNEYLVKTGEKKTELISAYGEYTKQLEGLIDSLLEIQADLREIVRTEAAMIASRQKKTKLSAKKTKSKKRKKTRKRKKIKRRRK